MFASCGFFRGLNCPDYARVPGRATTCRRPYCHFRHVRRDTDETSKSAVSSTSTENKEQSSTIKSGSKSDYVSTSLPNWKKKGKKGTMGQVKRRGVNVSTTSYVPTSPLVQFQGKATNAMSAYDNPFGQSEEYDPLNADLGCPNDASGKYTLDSDLYSCQDEEYIPTGNTDSTLQNVLNADKYSCEPGVHGSLEYDPHLVVSPSESKITSQESSSSKYQDSSETSVSHKYTIEKGPATDLEYDPLENSSLDAVQATDDTQRYAVSDTGVNYSHEYDPTMGQRSEMPLNTEKYSLEKHKKSDMSTVYGVEEYDPLETVETHEGNQLDFDYSLSVSYSYSTTSSTAVDEECNPSEIYSSDILSSTYSVASDENTSLNDGYAPPHKRKASADISDVQNKKSKSGEHICVQNEDEEDDIYNGIMDAWFSEDEDENSENINSVDVTSHKMIDDEEEVAAEDELEEIEVEEEEVDTLVIDLEDDDDNKKQPHCLKSNSTKEQIILQDGIEKCKDLEMKQTSENQKSNDMSKSQKIIDNNRTEDKEQAQDENHISVQSLQRGNGVRSDEASFRKTNDADKRMENEKDEQELACVNGKEGIPKANSDQSSTESTITNIHKLPAQITKPRVSSEQLKSFFDKRMQHDPKDKQNTKSKKVVPSSTDNIFNRMSKSSQNVVHKKTLSESNKRKTTEEIEKTNHIDVFIDSGKHSKETNESAGYKSREQGKSSAEKLRKSSSSNSHVLNQHKESEKDKPNTDTSKTRKTSKPSLGTKSGNYCSNNKLCLSDKGEGRTISKPSQSNKSEVDENSVVAKPDSSVKNASRKNNLDSSDKTELSTNSKTTLSGKSDVGNNSKTALRDKTKVDNISKPTLIDKSEVAKSSKPDSGDKIDIINKNCKRSLTDNTDARKKSKLIPGEKSEVASDKMDIINKNCKPSLSDNTEARNIYKPTLSDKSEVVKSSKPDSCEKIDINNKNYKLSLSDNTETKKISKLALSDKSEVVKISKPGLSDKIEAVNKNCESGLSNNTEVRKNSKPTLSDKSEVVKNSKPGLGDKIETVNKNPKPGVRENTEVRKNSKPILNDKSKVAENSKPGLSDKIELANKNCKPGLSDNTELRTNGKSALSDKSEVAKNSKPGLSDKIEAMNKNCKSGLSKAKKISKPSLNDNIEGKKKAKQGLRDKNCQTLNSANKGKSSSNVNKEKVSSVRQKKQSSDLSKVTTSSTKRSGSHSWLFGSSPESSDTLLSKNKTIPSEFNYFSTGNKPSEGIIDVYDLTSSSENDVCGVSMIVSKQRETSSTSTDDATSRINRATSKQNNVNSRAKRIGNHKSRSCDSHDVNHVEFSSSSGRRLSEFDLFGNDSSDEEMQDDGEVIFIKKTSQADIEHEVIELLSSDDEAESKKSSSTNNYRTLFPEDYMGHKKLHKESPRKHTVKSNDHYKNKHTKSTKNINSKYSVEKTLKGVSCPNPNGAIEKVSKDKQNNQSRLKKHKSIHKVRHPVSGKSKQNLSSGKGKTKPANKHGAIINKVAEKSKQMCVNHDDDDSDAENYALSNEQIDTNDKSIPDDYYLDDTDISFSETDTYDECLRIFNETTVTPNDNKKRQASATLEKNKDFSPVVGKQRVAHAPKFETDSEMDLDIRVFHLTTCFPEAHCDVHVQYRMRKIPKRPMVRPSPSQVCHNRFLIAQHEAVQKVAAQYGTQQPSDGKRVAHTPNFAQSSAPVQTNSYSRNLPTSHLSPPKATHRPAPYVSPKRRIMEKFATVHRANSGWEIPGTTLATTANKSGKRQAHRPTKVNPRPIIAIEHGCKVPSNVRQRYLNLFIDEFLKTCDTEQKAFEEGLKEEKAVYGRANTKAIYLNLSINALKRLRTERAGPSGAVPSSPTPKNAVSHLAVLGGKLATQHTYTLHRSAATRLDLDVYQGKILFDKLQPYIMTTEQLWDNGYPRTTEIPGLAEVKEEEIKATTTADPNQKVCSRCGKTFLRRPNGQYITRDTCTFHWGKLWRQRVSGMIDHRYSCCSGDSEAKGCCVSKLHVTEDKTTNMSGFMKTCAKSPPPDGNPGVYGLDCEMCYTVKGLELTRVTVVDDKLKQVYDNFVKPENEVVDYNTKFSGITEENLKSVDTRLHNVQAVLLSMFSSETILIGHSLESDLLALKMIHSNVIDTAIVFPHKRGPPYKRALKTLMAECLKRIIQNDVGGHDSMEDAKSCMELMIWKVKEDVKARR